MSLDDALKRAYEMGKDCGLNSPNTTNCNFALFATMNRAEADEHRARLFERVILAFERAE